MNVETIIVALITAGFAFLGVYMSNRKQAALVAYRLEKLEEKVDKHNSVVERMYHKGFSEIAATAVGKENCK